MSDCAIGAGRVCTTQAYRFISNSEQTGHTQVASDSQSGGAGAGLFGVVRVVRGGPM